MSILPGINQGFAFTLFFYLLQADEVTNFVRKNDTNCHFFASFFILSPGKNAIPLSILYFRKRRKSGIKNAMCTWHKKICRVLTVMVSK